MKKQFTFIIFLSAFMFIMGSVAGSKLFFSKSPKPKVNPNQGENKQNSDYATYIRQRNNNYKFISPLLDSVYQDGPEGYYAYEASIVSAIKQESAKHSEDEISVYFKDLTNLSWAGVGEKADYNPASLVKLPLAMAYYKIAETQSSILDDSLSYTGPDMNLQRNIKSEHIIETGKPYTVRELIKYMLLYSDNNALEALWGYKPEAVGGVFSDLTGTDLPKTRNGFAKQDFISPQEQMLYWVVLYNASYLSREYSEEILNLLSQSEYQQGIVGGVPKNIVVSQKFGETSLTSENQKKVIQFHDCGIIYYPKNPYALCIMTRGDDLAELQNIVKAISSIVFGEVSKKD